MKNFIRIKALPYCILLLTLAGCGEKFQTYPSQFVQPGLISKAPDHNNITDPSQPNDTLKFCSPLNFDNIDWDPALDLNAQRSFAIALSISGGFEGSLGWQNITNNFDGMGLSAGLLNQTLGTESLQPLIENIAKNHQQEFASLFEASHLTSILSMINQWRPATLHVQEFHPSEIENFSAKNSSVQWAINTLYDSNGSFLPKWKQELQNMLLTKDYINLQVRAALGYHQQTLQYLARTGFHDLRAYLLMFDIVTQNGSIKESRFQEWETQVSQNRITDEAVSLKALVEIRLQDTLDKWRADVRARKYTLIDGIGTVHGVNWDLPKAFCYHSNDPTQ